MSYINSIPNIMVIEKLRFIFKNVILFMSNIWKHHEKQVPVTKFMIEWIYLHSK